LFSWVFSTDISLKILIFKEAMTCSLLEMFRRLIGCCCHQHQGRWSKPYAERRGGRRKSVYSGRNKGCLNSPALLPKSRDVQ